jgi:hypothetical protein
VFLLRRPSKKNAHARTLLVRKASLPPRKTGAPLRPARRSSSSSHATGGSGGNTMTNYPPTNLFKGNSVSP